VELGSWRDPQIVGDVRLLVGLGVLVLVAAVVPEGLLWFVLGPVLAGTLVAVVMLVRTKPAPFQGDPPLRQPHPGPNMSRIPVQGLPGLVLAAGFIWMFWFGVPGFRPVVVGVAVTGCLAGIGLVVMGRRRRLPPATPLHLALHEERRAAEQPDAADSASRRRPA
jgi:hypothetical protein